MVLSEDVKKMQADSGGAVTNAPYNSRNAQANATLQDAEHLNMQNDVVQTDRQKLLEAHAAGSISAEEYNRQNTLLTNRANQIAQQQKVVTGSNPNAQQQIDNSQSTYSNSQNGFGSVAQNGTVSIAGSGAIQQSAINQIKKQHPEWTDAQIVAQINSQTPAIQSTTSNTGLGMNYDSKGIAIPGSEGQMGLNAAPSAKVAANAKAASDAQISTIKGYKTIQTGTDSKGNPIYSQVEDPAETARLQQEAKNAADIKAGGDASYAASLNNNQNQNTNPGTSGASALPQDNPLPPPEPSTFLDSLDALEKQYAGTSMAPIFDLYKQQYIDSTAKGLRGEALIKEVKAKTDAYVLSQKIANKTMKESWMKIYDEQQQDQLDSAARTYDQSTRLADQQKQQDQLLYDRAIRDQNIKNEQDRQSLLLNNGITGGWRSSMHTSKMIDAFKMAENKISDLYIDKINNGDVWQNKLIDIENTYHSNVTATYDAHKVSLLQLQDKLNERAAAIDKVVYDSDVSQLNAVNKLIEDGYADVAKIADNTTASVIQIQKDVQTATDKAADNLRQEQNNILNEESRHIANYGDTNPTGWQSIQDRKAALGLDTYDAVPTLAQMDKQTKSQLSNLSTTLISDPKSVINGTNYGLLGVNSFSSPKYSADEIQRGLQNVQTLLRSGQVDQAKHQILNNARQGMSVTQQEQITSQDSLIQEIGFMKGEMSEYSPTFGPLWSNLVQSLKPIAGQSKDPAYVDFVSHVQRVLGEERHRLFGSALSGTENSQADQYLFNPAIDTAATLTKKLANLEEIARRSRTNRYDEILGNGAYSSLTGEKLTTNTQNSTPNTKLLTPQQEYDSIKNLWGSPTSFNSPQSGGGQGSDTAGGFYSSLGTVTQDFNSPIASKENGGLYDSSTVSAWGGKHAGLDVAMKSGTPILFPADGEVIEAGYEPGWGGTVVIRDSNGAEHRFSHLQNIEGLSKGNRITRGSLIGLTGGGKNDNGRGDSTGSHLDYRIRYGGKYIDPLTYSV